jgi:F0F1-type ATP synthase membrane subunit c/vacuolar-type H+-ATPase subunit K
MFPDKNSLVRKVNQLLAVYVIGPGVYTVTVIPVVLGKRGFARDPNVVFPIFLALLAVSAIDVGLVAFFQTSKRVMADRARWDPLGRIFLLFSLGAVLSEALAIYGLVITLLSGSIIYIIGFSLATWACLAWVRTMFKRNLENIPDR